MIYQRVHRLSTLHCTAANGFLTLMIRKLKKSCRNLESINWIRLRNQVQNFHTDVYIYIDYMLCVPFHGKSASGGKQGIIHQTYFIAGGHSYCVGEHLSSMYMFRGSSLNRKMVQINYLGMITCTFLEDVWSCWWNTIHCFLSGPWFVRDESCPVSMGIGIVLGCSQNSGDR